MAGSRTLPASLAQRAREFVNHGLTPVPARPASTVILLRDAAAGLEAYLLKRRSSMPFAPGMHAFPGGAVDPRDVSDEDVRWFGPTIESWADRLGTDPAAARGFVCAAVRETFEEANVALTHPNVEPRGAEWAADRAGLVERHIALSELLDRRELAVRSDLLAPWAHWITPRFEERRYDTWFFVAAVPDGQEPEDVSGEADRAEWVRPSDAVAAAERGDVAMLPPTRVVLEELATYRAVTDVLGAAAGRAIPAIMPGWIDDGTAVRALLPGDPEFPGDDHGR
jgi:8-oxo-dGTP pyrophosphatase MutT (NUDIX family)